MGDTYTMNCWNNTELFRSCDIQFPQDFRFLKSPIGCDTNIRGKILYENFTTDKKT